MPLPSGQSTDHGGDEDSQALLQRGSLPNPLISIGQNPLYSPDVYAESTSTPDNEVSLDSPSVLEPTAGYVQNTLLQGTTNFEHWQRIDKQVKTISRLFFRTDLTPEMFFKAINDFNKFKAHADAIVGDVNFPNQSYLLQHDSNPTLQRNAANSRNEIAILELSIPTVALDLINKNIASVKKQMEDVHSSNSLAKAEKALQQLQELRDRYGKHFDLKDQQNIDGQLSYIAKLGSDKRRAHGGKTDEAILDEIDAKIKMHREKIVNSTSSSELHRALHAFEQFQAEIAPTLAKIKRNPSESVQVQLSAVNWNLTSISDIAHESIQQKIKDETNPLLNQMKKGDSSASFKTEYGTSNIMQLINATFIARSAAKSTHDPEVLRSELEQATTALRAEVTRISAQNPRDQAALNALEPKIRALQQLHAEYCTQVNRVKGSNNDQVQQNTQSTIADAYNEIRDHSAKVRATVKDQTARLIDLQSRRTALNDAIFNTYKSADGGDEKLSNKGATTINHELKQLSNEIKKLETELAKTHSAQRTTEQLQMITELNQLKTDLAQTKKNWAKGNSLQMRVIRRFRSEKVDKLEGAVQMLPAETPLQAETKKLTQLKKQLAEKIKEDPTLSELPELLDNIINLANSGAAPAQDTVTAEAQRLADVLLKFKQSLARRAHDPSPQVAHFMLISQAVSQAEKTLIATVNAVGSNSTVVLPPLITGKPLEPTPGEAAQRPASPSL